MGREGWAAAIVGSVGQEWDVERRFRVTEVALAIMWVCGIPTLICTGVYLFLIYYLLVSNCVLLY